MYILKPLFEGIKLAFSRYKYMAENKYNMVLTCNMCNTCVPVGTICSVQYKTLAVENVGRLIAACPNILVEKYQWVGCYLAQHIS